VADDPIDTTDTPFVNAECAGCGTNVVAVPEHAATSFCIECGRAAAEITHAWAVPVPVDPPELARPTYLPPPAVYPPTEPTEGLRVADPDVAGRCLAHPPASPESHIRLMSLDPDDIAVAFGIHDHLWHNPTGWLIGGPGGADGDICNPCGGGGKDKRPLTTVLDNGEAYTGPRHDLCLRGNPRGGWGRNCPCQHDRPYMRGVKPDDAGSNRGVDRVQSILGAHRPPPVTAKPAVAADFLWSPEEEQEADHD
jgi:hypothetical protein